MNPINTFQHLGLVHEIQLNFILIHQEYYYRFPIYHYRELPDLVTRTR
jgi:hypothetical protein